MMKPSLFGTLTLCAFAFPVIGQEIDDAVLDALDPYTVYGEVSDYQAWPLSASAVSGEALEAGNRQDQRDIAAVIPNMAQTDSGLRSYGDVASMRGLTNTPFFGSPSVVQYVDDVAMGTYSLRRLSFTPWSEWRCFEVRRVGSLVGIPMAVRSM